MTEKELLYVEDALQHLNDMKAKFQAYEETCNDQSLKNFISSVCSKQEQLFQNFFSLLQ